MRREALQDGGAAAQLCRKKIKTDDAHEAEDSRKVRDGRRVWGMTRPVMARGTRMGVDCRDLGRREMCRLDGIGGEEEERGKLVIGERLSGGGRTCTAGRAKLPLPMRNGRERAG